MYLLWLKFFFVVILNLNVLINLILEVEVDDIIVVVVFWIVNLVSYMINDFNEGYKF